MVAALYSNSINIVQSLLSAGADIHLTDSINYTALDYALMSNNPEIAQLLLQHMGDNNTEYRQPIESEKQIQQLSLDEHLCEDFEPSSHSLITSIDKVRHAIEHPLPPHGTLKHHQDEEDINNLPQQQQD